MVVTGVILFLIALEFGGVTEPWDSPMVLCLLIFGILLLAGFVVYEAKFASEPVMPVR